MAEKQFLQTTCDKLQQEFIDRKTLLSFDDYLGLVEKEPQRYIRNSAQYIKEMLEYFGRHPQKEKGKGKGKGKKKVMTNRGFKLFDLPFDQGVNRVIGLEMVQHTLYRYLCNFVQQGKVDKLLLLHGPNGSAKTSVVNCLSRGLEEYSTNDEGIIYSFNWIFPKEKLVKGNIGFQDKDGEQSTSQIKSKSYAYLDVDSVDAKLFCDLKDHPLFLLSQELRAKLFKQWKDQNILPKSYVISDYLLKGDLCPKCKMIFEALFNAYRGDFSKLLQHIQVERFYFSRKYRQGLVSIDPQMSVDANSRQITQDASTSALPPSLKSLNLFEFSGALVNSNRGMLEYNDMLKRPIESFKYLLPTCENNQVSLPNALLRLDGLFIGTSNDTHFDAFKEYPDFNSFKARIELIKVPYILRYSQEKMIYDEIIKQSGLTKHIAPHVTTITSMWAVLSRLIKPDPNNFPKQIREIIEKLSPVEKMKLYDHGELPLKLSSNELKELKKCLGRIFKENARGPFYEGRFGASVRELRMVLLNAAQNPRFKCFNPQAVFGELSRLAEQKDVYPFLNRKAEGEYYDNSIYIKMIIHEYLEMVDNEVSDSMGLADESSYKELFERYVFHVRHWIKKEKYEDEVSGQLRDPDKQFMQHMENIIVEGKEDYADFRRSLITKIGAFRLEHPEGDLEYKTIFPNYLNSLKEDFFKDRREVINSNKEHFIRYMSDEKRELDDKDLKMVEKMLSTMKNQYNYCEHCARDAIIFLLKNRYN